MYIFSNIISFNLNIIITEFFSNMVIDNIVTVLEQ